MKQLMADKVHVNSNESMAAAVDISVLISLESAQADGEPDLIVELIDLYLQDTPRRLAVMSSLCGEQDAVSLRKEAHGLKGSSATLGAAGVVALCQDIEQLEHRRPSETSADVLIALSEEFERVREAFLAERHNRTNPESGRVGNK
jgi:HPt (histidine-containing phosphotransfer) domain-containing protein